MTNTISPYFTDEDLEHQIRLQFPEEEQYTMNYKTVFNQIEDEGDCLSLRLRGKRLLIDKLTGVVKEAET